MSPIKTLTEEHKQGSTVKGKHNHGTSGREAWWALGGTTWRFLREGTYNGIPAGSCLFVSPDGH